VPTKYAPLITCTVVGFLESSYEKYPEYDAQIIMEYDGFTDLLADNLPAPLDTDKDF
jgi:hypothetical protein